MQNSIRGMCESRQPRTILFRNSGARVAAELDIVKLHAVVIFSGHEQVALVIKVQREDMGS